jgi:sugar phosphate isomerase/epimerase
VVAAARNVKLALSEISTVSSSFAEDISAYARAGFDGIGIWEFKLPADDEANRMLLQEAGLGVANCVPAVPSILPLRVPGMEGPADPQERVEALCASVRRLAGYDPESVICLTGPAGDLPDETARQVTIAGLRRIAGVARETGVTLGLEPIRAAERDATTIVTSISEAVELLDEAGLADVGIMVDTYNVGDTPSAFEDLARWAKRIAGVHVADAPTDPDRSDRALPGEGSTPTRRLVEALRAAGWDGYLDVEIFSTPDRFWALPLDEAAQRAYAAARSLL